MCASLGRRRGIVERSLPPCDPALLWDLALVRTVLCHDVVFLRVDCCSSKEEEGLRRIGSSKESRGEM